MEVKQATFLNKFYNYQYCIDYIANFQIIVIKKLVIIYIANAFVF